MAPFAYSKLSNVPALWKKESEVQVFYVLFWQPACASQVAIPLKPENCFYAVRERDD
tara:strand:+ start:528 stop:698 length:171 start_codon:yes stop_codon:yes gene_type:complete